MGALDFSYRRGADLSPLRGVPLRTLMCASNPVPDLFPLARMPLTSVRCNVLLFDDAFEELLRNLPMKTVNQQRADEFWEKLAVDGQAAEEIAMRTAGLPPDEQVDAVTSRLSELDDGRSAPLGATSKTTRSALSRWRSPRRRTISRR